MCMCGGVSLVAQRVKRLPAIRETWVRSPGWEDPLEKEIVTHSSILPRKSHGWRSLVGYSPRGRKELDTTERLHLTFTMRHSMHSCLVNHINIYFLKDNMFFHILFHYPIHPHTHTHTHTHTSCLYQLA